MRQKNQKNHYLQNIRNAMFALTSSIILRKYSNADGETV